MGTNTLSSASDGTVIPASDNNQYKTALGEDLVPRNTSGVPTDQGGSLGTTILRWLNAYINKIFIGAIASGLTIEESTGDLVLSVGGSSKKFQVSVNSVSALEASGSQITLRASSNDVLTSTNTATTIKTGGTTRAVIDSRGLAKEYYELVKTESASCGNFTSSSTTFVDVTNLSVSITTHGRPVVILCYPDGTNTTIEGFSVFDVSTSPKYQAQLLRDSTVLFLTPQYNESSIPERPDIIQMIDTPSAGTYVYKVQMKLIGSGTIFAQRMKLIAFEL